MHAAERANLANLSILISSLFSVHSILGSEDAAYFYIDLADVDPVLLPSGGAVAVEVRGREREKRPTRNQTPTPTQARARHFLTFLTFLSSPSLSPRTPRASTPPPPPSATREGAPSQAPGPSPSAACCSCTQEGQEREKEERGLEQPSRQQHTLGQHQRLHLPLLTRRAPTSRTRKRC